MTNTRHATVLVDVPSSEQSGSPDKQTVTDQAIGKALSIVPDVSYLDMYYRFAAPLSDCSSPVVSFESETGLSRVDYRLEETRTNRISRFQELIEYFENTSAEDAAQDYDLMRSLRILGTHYHPQTLTLFDGTGYSFGSPIINRDRLEAITDRFSASALYTVEVELHY